MDNHGGMIWTGKLIICPSELTILPAVILTKQEEVAKEIMSFF
jgi:hypothetical protein